MPTVEPQLEQKSETPPVSAMPSAVHRAGRRIVIALLILSPLLCLPPGVLIYNSMDVPRRLILLLGAGLLVGLILKSWSMRGRIVLRRHPLDIPVLLFFLAGLVAGIGGVYPRISLFGPLWYHDSMLLLGVCIALYFGVKEFLRTREEMQGAINIMVLVGGVSAAIGLFDHFFHHFHPVKSAMLNPYFSGHRLVATMGNPMFTGVFFATLAPLGLGATLTALNDPNRRSALLGTLLAASTALMTMAWFLTQTRSAWIGLMVAVPVLLGLTYWRIMSSPGGVPHATRRAINIVAWGLPFLILVMVLLAPAPLKARLKSMTDVTSATVQTRFVYWQGAWNMFLARPVQGWGLGNHKIVFPQYRPYSLTRELDLPMNRGYTSAQPHNIVLQTATEMGVLGLAAFIGLVVMAYLAGVRYIRREPIASWMGIGLIGMLTAYLVSVLSTFDNAGTMAQFWVGLGLLAAFTAEDRAPAPRWGALSRHFSAYTAKMVSIASLVLMLGAGLHFLFEATTARLAYAATQLTVFAPVSFAKSPAQGLVDSRKALELLSGYKSEDIHRYVNTLNLTVPSQHFNHVMLALAYKVRMDLAADLYNGMIQAGRDPNTPEVQHVLGIAKEARTEMFRNGHQALRMVDRDHLMLRYLAMEYTASGEYEKARPLILKLLRYEPNSSEVHLIYAELLAEIGDSDQAAAQATIATRLDPTFGEAYAMLAHYQNLMVMDNDPRSGELIFEICENFGIAERKGVNLSPEHKLEYAINLFLAGRIEKGIEKGREIQNSPYFEEFIEKVGILFRALNKPELGHQVIARLTEGYTPEPPPRQPAPAEPAAPVSEPETTVPALPF